jgi:hypothetical protein
MSDQSQINGITPLSGTGKEIHRKCAEVENMLKE